MVKVTLACREHGSTKIDFSIDFDLPEVPKVDSYISVNRPHHKKGFTEDFIVKKVLWQLNHKDEGAYVEAGKGTLGKVDDIFIICDPALSDTSGDAWRRSLSSSVNVEEFEIAGYGIRESDFDKE